MKKNNKSLKEIFAVALEYYKKKISKLLKIIVTKY